MPLGARNFTRLNFTPPTLRPNDSAYQWSRSLPTTVLVDHKTFRHHMLGFFQLGVAIVMNCSQRFAYFYALADAFLKFEPHGMVDAVFFGFAAPTQHGQRGPKLFAV